MEADLTAHLQQRIARLELDLAAQRDAMQDFGYTVSHDLRASLRHISSYTQLVQEEAGPHLSADAQGFLNIVADAARHLGVQLDALMELARVGTAVMECQSVPLGALLEQACAAVMAGYPGRTVHWQIAQTLPIVLADPTLLALAVRQVVDNAVKFTAQAPTPTVRIGVYQDATQGLVHLTIADNGAGFNQELQNKLFRPFSRLHTVKQFPGLGIGLALTAKALQRMGGLVQAQGQTGAGCTVTLTIPAAH